MTQRKCGTCRYFEEGGIAASGWCRHPERQELQHMVLVRKTELACRDGWDHDLWEPKDGTGGTGGMPSGGGVRSGVPSPSGSGEPGRGGPAAESGMGSEAWHPQSGSNRQAPRSVLESDRESFDDWSTNLRGTIAGDREPADEIQGETFSRRGMRDEPASSSAPEHNYLDDQSPEGQGAYREREAPWSRQDPERRPAGDEPRSANRSGKDNPWSSDAPRFGVVGNGYYGSHEPELGEYEADPVEQSGLTDPFDVAEPEDEMPQAEPRQNGEVAEPEFDPDEWLEPDYTAREPVDDGGVSMNVPLSLQQQQRCGTCRDFRPTDGGRRGWCANAFAFEQRTQVDANDLACQGTFGNWWSPTDDWWTERADISNHSTPTPLVDEMIREIHEHGSEGRGSTEKQKRS